MGKKRKECAILHCKIEKGASDILVEFCNSTGLSKTVTVEKALKFYIENYNRTGKL